MSLSRRELLGASALVLAGPGALLRADAATACEAAPVVLCWNENPYGPSPAARATVSQTIASGCRYPSDAEMQALVSALAAHEGVPVDHITTGSGSGELLCALGLLYGGNGGQVVAAQPTYGELPEYVAPTRRGAEVRAAGQRAAPRPASHARGAVASDARRVRLQPQQSDRDGGVSGAAA